MDMGTTWHGMSVKKWTGAGAVDYYELAEDQYVESK
jgi:hypothetical protein